MNYFQKFEALQQLYQELRDEYFWEIIEEGKGHFSSPILILTDSYQSELTQWFFPFFRQWLMEHPQITRGAKFHQCCLLSYNKGIEGFEGGITLSKELKILSPKVIVNLVDLKITGCPVFSLNSLLDLGDEDCNSIKSFSISDPDVIRLSQELEIFLTSNSF